MNDNRIIKAENVFKGIEKQGYYYILTEKYYGEDYLGSKYIIATDDPDFKVKNPKYAEMVIVPVDKFLKMAEAINMSLLNDRRERYRQTYLHNAEGYYEDGLNADDDSWFPLAIKDLPMNPVGDTVEERITNEQLIVAIDRLSDTEKRRVYTYFFCGETQLEIATKERVKLFAVQKSLASATKKLKKFLERGW